MKEGREEENGLVCSSRDVVQALSLREAHVSSVLSNKAVTVIPGDTFELPEVSVRVRRRG